MEDFQKEILERNASRKLNIIKSFIPDEEETMSNELEKGRKAQIGETREWKGGTYMKTASGWEKKVKTKMEKFVDEETGEMVEIEVEDNGEEKPKRGRGRRNPKNASQRRRERKEDKKERKNDKKYYEARNKLDDVKSDMKSVNSELMNIGAEMREAKKNDNKKDLDFLKKEKINAERRYDKLKAEADKLDNEILKYE